MLSLLHICQITSIYGKLSVMNCPGYKVITGKNPILISAPHVFAHRRPRLNMGYKKGEVFTDVIVKEICEKLDIFGIYTDSEFDYDPNFHKEKENDYKKSVRKIVEENKIKYFVDIHGLKDENFYDLGVYYPTRFARSREFAVMIQQGIGRFELSGINSALLRFLDNYQETLGEFVASKLRIPSVQLEIARYIREDSSLRDAFVKNLVEILGKKIV